MTNMTQADTLPITLLAVREIVADCLGIEVDEVTPNAKFFEDLQGESIDLIDLGFRFEKAFQVKASFKSLNSEQLWGRDESGHLTASAKEAIRRALPFLDIAQFDSPSEAFNPLGLLTAEFMYQMLQLAERS
jgi:acyl carrier protein